MYDCPRCECFDDKIEPRDFAANPLTPFEKTMREIYAPMIERQLRDVVAFDEFGH